MESIPSPASPRSAHSETPDAFAALGLDRAPWIDSGTLKDRFRDAASRTHPDSSGGTATAFAELNAAFSTLRDPARRLRLLVTLEFGATPRAKRQPAFQEGFEPAAEAAAEADSLLRDYRNAKTALGRATVRKRIAGTLRTLEHTTDAIENRIRELDTLCKNQTETWRNEDGAYWLGIASCYAFVQKWRSELLERTFRLSDLE